LDEIILLETSKLVITSQPIKDAGEKDQEKLIYSIREVGLLYPLIVRPMKQGKYEVLDGRTRLGAIRELGYRTVKCIVRFDEEEKNQFIPYDVELYRRHLSNEEKISFEKTRQEKKQEAEKDAISHLIQRLPRKFQRRAEKYAEMFSDISIKRLSLKLLTTMAEPDLEKIFEQSEMFQNYSKIVSEKESLEKEIEDLKAQQDEEVYKRVKKFEEDFSKKYNEVKARGLVIPEDPEEKTDLMKKIEAAVREEMREEIKQLEKIQEENKKRELKLSKKLSDKEEELRKLRDRNKDLNVQIGMLDDVREHFNIMLNKSVDIKPIITKTRVFHSDLDAFSGRLHEWHNRPNVSGRGIFEDMTEENIFLLEQELDILKKKFSEIKSLLRR